MLSTQGRHRAFKPGRARAQRLIATAGLTGVGLAIPLATAGSASAASVSTWDRVASCESSGDWSISTGNGYYGGLQFSPDTWAAYGGTQYAATADQASKSQQIAVAEKVLASQGPGAWPVCGPEAGLSQGGAPAQVDTSSSGSGSSSSASSSSSSDADSAFAHKVEAAAKSDSSISSSTYTVASGDWLSTIAQRQHVAGGWERLYALNRATLTEGPDVIYPGEQLVLGGAVSGKQGSGTSSDSGDSSTAATVDASTSTASSSGSTSASASSGTGLAAATSFAEAQVGDPYVYGGTGPYSWDCSGLVQAALAKAGISAPRTSEDQAAASTRVSLDALQPGDLLFWSNDGTDSGAYHVALYTGDGKYVEAANPSAGVKTDTIANWAPDFAGRIG